MVTGLLLSPLPGGAPQPDFWAVGSRADFLRLGQRRLLEKRPGSLLCALNKGLLCCCRHGHLLHCGDPGCMCAPPGPAWTRSGRAAMAGPWVCPRPAPPARAVSRHLAGAGQDLSEVGGLAVGPGTKGRPHSLRVPSAPTSPACTRPLLGGRQPALGAPPAVTEAVDAKRGRGAGTPDPPRPGPESGLAGSRGAGRGAWSVAVPAWGWLCASRGGGAEGGSGREREVGLAALLPFGGGASSPSSRGVPGRELAASYWKCSEAVVCGPP